jgi:uncharacterized membrane protein
MISLWILLGLGLTDLAAFALCAVLPLAHIHGLYFGVPVPEEARREPDVLAVRRRYLLQAALVAGAGVAAGLGLGAATGWAAEAIVLPPIVLHSVGILLAIAAAHRAALRLQAKRGWTLPDSAKRVANLRFRQKQRMIGIGWYGIHLAVIALGVLAAIAGWDRIPDLIATHYGINGEPDHYSAKTIGSVFQLNLIQLGMLAVFLIVHGTMRQAGARLDPQHPESSMQQEIRQRRVMSIFIYGLSLLTIAFMGYIQGSLLFGWSMNLLLIGSVLLPLALIGATAGLALYLIRRGLYRNAVPQMQEERHWKGGGFFYYNPDDPALLVPKRYGIGMTFNFARPLSWVILAAVVLLPIAVIVAAEMAYRP